MITSAAQLEQWMKWVEEDPKEALRAMQCKIDGLGRASKEQIERARKEYAHGSDDNLEIDDDASVSTGDYGYWVQAWVWLDTRGL
jgi:hypothetical protein